MSSPETERSALLEYDRDQRGVDFREFKLINGTILVLEALRVEEGRA